MSMRTRICREVRGSIINNVICPPAESYNLVDRTAYERIESAPVGLIPSAKSLLLGKKLCGK